jgi:hypothetical protein
MRGSRRNDCTVADSTAPGMLPLSVAFLVALPMVVIVARRLRLPYTVVFVVVEVTMSAG